MFGFLLILHILAVCCWMGGALYERFYIVSKIRSTKGTEMEAPLIKLLLGTAPFYLTAVGLILITGAVMTVMNDYGFFDFSWVGVKQYIFILIMLVFFLFIGPRMGKAVAQVNESMSRGEGVSERTRSLLKRIVILLDIIHVGVLFNIVLAVTKFF